jgi:biopolymer transport protein ExbB
MDKLQYIGPIGLPILFLSLIGLTIIIERIIFYIKVSPIDKCAVLTTIKQKLEENSKQPKAIRDEIATFLLIQAKKPYDFGIKILRVIAVISPMLGLLGTVLGIIESFKKISMHEGPVYPALIAEGLWTAMLTTAAGLIVALPCLFAAFVFARLAEKRISSYQNELNRISLKLEGVSI